MESLITEMIQKQTKVLIDNSVNNKLQNILSERANDQKLIKNMENQLKRQRDSDEKMIKTMENQLKRQRLTISTMQNKLDILTKKTSRSTKIFDKFTEAILLAPKEECDETVDDDIFEIMKDDAWESDDKENAQPSVQKKKKHKLSVTINDKNYEVFRNTAGRPRPCYHANMTHVKKMSERFLPMLSKNNREYGRRVCCHIHDGFHCHWRAPGGKWQEGKTPASHTFDMIEI